MSDRDLLEAAARAAGIALGEWSDFTATGVYQPGFRYLGDDECTHNWNPLTNDGDEARLEAALDLAVEWGRHSVGVGKSWKLFADHGGDKQAARRRAGVRAAAALTQPEGGA